MDQPINPQEQKPKVDKLGWIVVLCCLATLLLYSNWSAKQARARQQSLAATQAAQKEQLLQTEEGQIVASAAPLDSSIPAVSTSAPSQPQDQAAAQTAQLENDQQLYQFSSLGSGIESITLKNETVSVDSEELIVLNKIGNAAIGALSNDPALPNIEKGRLISSDASTVVFESTLPDGLSLKKTFSLSPANHEQSKQGTGKNRVHLRIDFINKGEQPINLGKYFLYTGASHSFQKSRLIQPSYIWNDGGDTGKKDISYFRTRKVSAPKSEYLRSFESPQWVGTMNRFYVCLLSPVEVAPAKGWSRRVPLSSARDKGLLDFQDSGKFDYGIHGGLSLPELLVPPQQTVALNYNIYAGAKKYSELQNSGKERQKSMFYGIFTPISAILMKTTTFFHQWVDQFSFIRKIGSWGVAIILMTLLIRILIWPLHAKSTRTMKKMSLLGPKLTELREKFADEPQKLNMEMMQLYRRYGVNPMGGCIPVLFQMPIFFGFYRMLMAAAELRGEKFAWVKDLSLPDTQFEIAGLPINPMPILMAVTMVIQMAVTPQTGDKTQRIIFMLMPVMFLFICYNFASALALYWTTTNIFSIFQTWLMRLQPEPELIDKNQQAKEQKQAEKKQKKGSRPSMGGGSGQKSRKK